MELGVDASPPHQKWSAIAGYVPVTTSALCVLTRMRLRHCWDLPLAYLKFRRVARHCPALAPGLMRYAFTVESPWTFHTISIWRDTDTIHLFGNLPEHVDAARWTFHHAEEIWSAEFSLSGLSTRTRWGTRIFADELASEALTQEC